jgi:hypothetical protein
MMERKTYVMRFKETVESTVPIHADSFEEAMEKLENGDFNSSNVKEVEAYNMEYIDHEEF